MTTRIQTLGLSLYGVLYLLINFRSRASVLETLLTALTRLVLQNATYRRQRRSTQTGVRYADSRSSVGRRFRSATKLRLAWYGGVFLLLLLQQRSKHPREMVIPPKASTSLFLLFPFCRSVRSSNDLAAAVPRRAPSFRS